MRAQPFTPDDADRWDELVARAPMATFLHTRRFLSYHGDRFDDASLLLLDARGRLRALLPAALDPAAPSRVVSHPGATFGGLVHGGELDALAVRDALVGAAGEYAERGLSTLVYVPVPYIYHRSPSADDVWVIADLGAERTGCALSTAIDLKARNRPSGRRKRSRKKAETAGVAVHEDATLAEFWPVLEAALERRYGASPVHGLAEIEELQARFPAGIRLVTAVLDSELVGGAVLFATERVMHVQYMAASDDGMNVGAIDLILERAIERAAADGARYFDFGTSMEDGGDRLQEGLHTFKASFGGGGVLHERYELGLARDERLA